MKRARRIEGESITSSIETIEHKLLIGSISTATLTLTRESVGIAIFEISQLLRLSRPRSKQILHESFDPYPTMT